MDEPHQNGMPVDPVHDGDAAPNPPVDHGTPPSPDPVGVPREERVDQIRNLLFGE